MPSFTKSMVGGVVSTTTPSVVTDEARPAWFQTQTVAKYLVPVTKDRPVATAYVVTPTCRKGTVSQAPGVVPAHQPYPAMPDSESDTPLQDTERAVVLAV